MHPDTSQSEQQFGFGMELNEECQVEMRVRQYYNSDGEEYYEPIKWTAIRTGGDQHYVLPVNKNAVKAGGKTILELKYSSPNGDNFAQNIQVSVLTPWMHYYQIVPETRVVTICDEKDNYRFGFNGMEKDNEVKGLDNSLNYEARIYDSRLGRWLSRDVLAGKYPYASPFNFALNTPIWAKDADGNVVIFINGMHSGDGGQAKYWGGFDKKAMDRIGDHSARYVDGALGGMSNTLDNAKRGLIPVTQIGMYGAAGGLFGAAIKVLTSSNVSYKVRIEAGRNQGFKDAKSIIDNLTEGESIKIFTHSMGTAFSRGYVEGIQNYAKEHGISDKVKFNFQLDVSAFQGKSLPAIKGIPSYNKTGGRDGGKIDAWVDGLISVPSVEPVPGATDLSTEEDKDKGHAIGEMSTNNIPEVGNAGTATQKPIEQGVNNGR